MSFLIASRVVWIRSPSRLRSHLTLWARTILYFMLFLIWFHHDFRKVGKLRLRNVFWMRLVVLSSFVVLLSTIILKGIVIIFGTEVQAYPFLAAVTVSLLWSHTSPRCVRLSRRFISFSLHHYRCLHHLFWMSPAFFHRVCLWSKRVHTCRLQRYRVLDWLSSRTCWWRYSTSCCILSPLIKRFSSKINAICCLSCSVCMEAKAFSSFWATPLNRSANTSYDYSFFLQQLNTCLPKFMILLA